jgi:hypothetical protein
MNLTFGQLKLYKMTNKISLYKTCRSKASSEVSLMGVIHSIKHGDHEELVKELRNIEGKKERQEFKAKYFRAFTWCGTFKGGHGISNLHSYNQIVGLDYDNVKDIKALKESLSSIDTSHIVFISPGGEGLKVLVKVNSDASYHDKAFEIVNNYYKEITGMESDNSVKDISRLCYVSWDPDLYLEEDSKVFDIHAALKLESVNEVNIDYLFNKSMLGFSEGNRHNVIISCAGKANTLGISKNEVINYFNNLSNISLTLEEIETTINDIYSRYSHQFNSVSPKKTDSLSKKNSLSPSVWFNNKGKLNHGNFINDLSKKIVVIPEIERVFAKSEEGYPLFDNSHMNISYADFYFFLLDNGANFNDTNFMKIFKTDAITKLNPLSIFYNIVKQNEWDGHDRITELINAMNLEGDKEKMHYLLSKFFYTMYAFGLRGIDPDLPKKVHSRVALILYSQERNSGKSSFLRQIGMQNKIHEWTGIKGLEIYAEYPDKPGRDSDDFDNNKSSKLVINFDDIQDLLINSNGYLRSLISEEVYSQRKKYDRNSQIFERRCAFVGSTNHKEIMNDKDETRFLIYTVKGEMDFEALNSIDMLQLWSQIRHDALYLGVEALFNTKDLSQIRIKAQEYMYSSNSDEILGNYFVFEPNPEPRLRYNNIEEILKRNGHFFKGNDLGNALKKLAPANTNIKKKSGDNYYYLVKIKDDMLTGGMTYPNSIKGNSGGPIDINF